MTPNVTFDTSVFDKAFRAYVVGSSRALPDVINSRMFFLMVRLYMQLGPTSPANSKKKLRKQLNELKPSASGREAKMIYLLANSLVKQKGKTRAQNAEALKKAVIQIRRSQIGGVGFLRSVVERAIRKFQFKKKVSRSNEATQKRLAGNSDNLVNKYQAVRKETVLFGQSKTASKAKPTYARDGFSPFAISELICQNITRLQGGLKTAFEGAMSEAIKGETLEMQNHLLNKLSDLARQKLSSEGFVVQ